MADGGGKSIGGAIATVLIAIVLIWVALKLLGVAFKLVALLIIGGLAIAAYLAVTKRIGGPGGRA
jgi:dolichol kinase